MSVASKKLKTRMRIKMRIRGKISGTAQRPRLTVFRSNKQIYAQVVDDLTILQFCAWGSPAAGATVHAGVRASR